MESCAGCGACCLEQGAPPDYVALRTNPEFAADPSFADDADRLARLPDEARGLLDQYLEQSARGARPRDGACVWYNPATTSCRFYDWRPSTCRVFEMNSPGCHIYRRRQAIDKAPM
ncbi:MAG: YkgJ family cysteine cluster protein [Planctomycetaceae bacterium]|nr:YkgJ family cysteine cluster protein [Planctomycetaceae bacterium]